MATFYLINTTMVGSQVLFPGTLIDDSFDNAAAIRAAGGVLWPSGNAVISAAAGLARTVKSRGGAWTAGALDLLMLSAAASVVSDFTSAAPGAGASLILIEDPAARIAGLNVEAALAELAGRVIGAVASETAIKAIPVATRVNGMMVVDLTNDAVWTFDSASSASADAWNLVPDAGTGRWVRSHVTLADLASQATGFGASLIGCDVTNNTLEAELAVLRAGIAAGLTASKRTLTATHTSLVAAAATETVNIGAALPANSRVVGFDPNGYTPFSGGTIGDFSVDIGTAGDVDAIADGIDLFAAAVDGGPATVPQGIRPNKFFAAGAQLIATFRCGSDDVADATAGAITLDVFYIVLP